VDGGRAGEVAEPVDEERAGTGAEAVGGGRQGWVADRKRAEGGGYGRRKGRDGAADRKTIFGSW
jgi:hypothetical protein